MTYPSKFDSSNLDKNQQLILEVFFQRRNLFDKYIKETKIELYACPDCGYPTLTERGGYEICSICNWEDDNQDDDRADEVWGGPNHKLSLTENRLNIGQQLVETAEQVGGRINNEPRSVISIIAKHEKILSELLKKIPEDADLQHPVLNDYNNIGKGLIRQLIVT